MAKPLSPARPSCSSRRSRPVAPQRVVAIDFPVSPEPEFDPEPVFELSSVTLPVWLMPTLHDLMGVAERTFGYTTGESKKRWVREALLDIVLQRERYEGVPAFAPQPYQRSLLDLLIEGVWGLHFQGSNLSRIIRGGRPLPA